MDFMDLYDLQLCYKNSVPMDTTGTQFNIVASLSRLSNSTQKTFSEQKETKSHEPGACSLEFYYIYDCNTTVLCAELFMCTAKKKWKLIFECHNAYFKFSLDQQDLQLFHHYSQIILRATKVISLWPPAKNLLIKSFECSALLRQLSQ